MKTTFEGHNQATDYAQSESKRQNKKMWVYLVKQNGVKYLVCDTLSRPTVGKLLGEYGKDPVYSAPTPTPVAPPPPPVVETPKEVAPEKVVEEKGTEEEVKVEEPVVEPPKVEEPASDKKTKKTTKKKTGE